MRAAISRMIGAHADLLKAELAITGKGLGIIAGLVVGALVVAMLVLILLYVGTFLFLGEWLFGSMGWGMIHGTLLGIGLIVAVAVNLAGGSLVSYGWGAVWGVIVGVVTFIVLWQNLAHAGARLTIDELLSGVDVERNLLAMLVGIVIGGIAVGVVLLIAGWRGGWRFGSPGGLFVSGFILGGFAGAILGPVLWGYRVAGGIALLVGLMTWMVAGLLLAYRRGFDPEARYADLIPRETIKAFQTSRTFVEEQWERQKGRMMGR